MFVGIDIGSVTTKAVIINEQKEILAFSLTLTSYDRQKSGADVLESALKEVGKGVYVIKLLNAGHLRDEAESSIRFVLQFHEFIDARNIGMYNENDVRRNLELLSQILEN